MLLEYNLMKTISNLKKSTQTVKNVVPIYVGFI